MSQCPHIDLLSPDSYVGGAPFGWLEELRRDHPVYWHDSPNDRDGGRWVITRQQDLDYISKNPKLFSSYARTCFPNEPAPEDIDMTRLLLINMDPPDHVNNRRIIRNAFTPRAMDAYEPRFKEIAKQIVDRVAVTGECEFVTDIAAELPLIAICEIMGIPIEDRRQFFEWTNTMIGADDPDLSSGPEDGQLASANIYMYAKKLADIHRENPRDNIVGALLDGVVEGEHLTDDAFQSFFLLLVVAGNETTRTVTSQGMRLLMEHPDELQKLVDKPELIPDFVEEILRFSPAIIQFTRTAMQDIEVGGQQIKQGQRVALFYHSANRDESVFAEPNKFDVTRPQREDVKHQHRAFGIGEHFCLGTHLARLELKVIFEEIIPRLRNPRLNGDVVWLRSTLIHGIKSMPVAFDPEV